MTQEPKIFPYIERLLQDAEVVWKPLGEVAEYIRGITYNKQAEIQHKDGWKVLRANNITLKSRQLDFNDIKVIDKSIKVRDNQHLYKGDILICAGSGSREHIGKTAYIFENLEYIFGGFMGVIRTNEEYLLSRFLFHYLGSSSFSTYLNKELNSSTINNLNSSIMNKFQIPLPPLSVQQEIVRILDKFTELEAELEAELDCRKRQYEYYRNHLLSYEGNEVVWKTLGEVGEVTKLAGFEFTNYVKYNDTGKIIALRGLNVKGSLDLSDVKYIDESDFSKLNRSKLYINDMLFTYVGTVGSVALIPENDKYYLAPNVARIRFLDRKINPRFMFHYFQSDEFEKKQINRYLGSSSMKNLTMENIRKFQIPLPPLEEQQRIASILDKFDTLVNSISEGLPREIALRRKQYEYYREQLLSFHKVTA